jgi:alpha-L-arabinofuranosidase
MFRQINNLNLKSMINRLFLAIVVFCGIFISNSGAQSVSPLIVKVDSPLSEIQPTMWGIFFEDINFAADGGIYAELVKNRSFEFYKPLMGWREIRKDGSQGSLLVENRQDENSQNPRYAKITTDGTGIYSIANEGFRGMGIKKDLQYKFSVMAKQENESSVALRIELLNSKDEIIGASRLEPSGTAWKKYEVSFSATQTEPKAKLNIVFEGKGSINLDMISLFPSDTWKNRSNGLRADLVQLLADLKPGFLRFPGGCIVEGHDLSVRYQWKKTIGPLEDRHMIVNRWNTEFAHRLTTDYFQSFGLGFFEYFQLAEDIGAEPLPILNCGMACQFNTSEVVPLNQLDPYIQDILDLIEFANGPVESKWGKIRAEMGHPAPFNLKMVGVGNEQWGPQYIERYKIFAKAIKEKYPNIKIVTGTGPFPDGKEFDYAVQELKNLKAEIVDEHYYRPPQWFLDNATRYDKYDRNSFKIFAGEYAAQSVAIASPDNKNNWQCALSEAAFMTGLERNADVVYMTSYAPLFAHAEGWQWTPDLIWFDNLRSYGTPNYYVQKLFANNRGTHLLSMTLDNQPITGQNKLYGSAVADKNTGEIILKIINASDKSQNVNILLNGAKKLNAKGKLIVLRSDNLKEMNSLDKPYQISPVEQEITLKGRKIVAELSPNSLSVFKIKQH